MMHMRTTVTIDDELFKQAQQLTGLPAKERSKPSRVLQSALDDYVRWKTRKRFVARMQDEGFDLTAQDLAKMREKDSVEPPGKQRR